MTGLRFADRTRVIQPFQVMELVKRASLLQAAGHPVIHMSIGEPDFKAPQPVVEALHRAVERGESTYTPALGIAPLRAAIARDYGRRYGLDIAPERVVVTAGASAALMLALCALANPGDHVLGADPGYPCNRHFVAAFDAIADMIPVGPQTRFQLTADLVERAWHERVAGVLLASPANPTGTSIAFDDMAAIVDVARSHGGFTLVDEIYLGLTYPQTGDPVPRSALALGDDVIVCNSFSKFFSMTGWRLGWLVVPPAAVPVFEKLSQNLFICASALAQHAALTCFEPETLAIYEQRRSAFRERRDYLVPALRAAGLDVPVTPDGAFYVYADCSAYGIDSTRFASGLLESEFVSIVPGTDFGSNDPQRYLRLSYATGIEQLREAVTRIGRYIESLQKGR